MLSDICNAIIRDIDLLYEVMMNGGGRLHVAMLIDCINEQIVTVNERLEEDDDPIPVFIEHYNVGGINGEMVPIVTAVERVIDLIELRGSSIWFK